MAEIPADFGDVTAAWLNEHVDLGPVLAATTSRLGLVAREGRWRRGDPAPELGPEPVSPDHLASTHFIVMARAPEDRDRLGPSWTTLAPSPQARAWTDDRVQLLRALR